MEMSWKELWDYIQKLLQEHRATRNVFLEKGKTYRSHQVTFESGYITALYNIQDYLTDRDAELKEAVKITTYRLGS